LVKTLFEKCPGKKLPGHFFSSRRDFCYSKNPHSRCMKKYFLFFILIIFCAEINAQQNTNQNSNAPVMVFDSLQYHFRIVRGKQIRLEFHFTNKGKFPLVIESAMTSANNNVASYPREPFKPGGKGMISVLYLADVGLGFHENEVTVNSNNRDGQIVLRLYSEIIADTTEAAIMTFETTTAYFGTVVRGTVIHKEFSFTNTGKNPLIITSAYGSGRTIADYPKEPILPGGKGIITVTFSTAGKTGIQDVTSSIVSNTKNGLVTLHLQGTVNIDTIGLPVMTFDSLSKHLGNFAQGNILLCEFHFTNTGKTPLIIQEIHTISSNEMTEYPTAPIPPNGTGILKYKFVTESKMGNQDRTIFIESNNRDGNVLLHVFATLIPDTANANGQVVLHLQGQVIRNPNGGRMTFDQTNCHVDTAISGYENVTIDFDTIFQGIVEADLKFTNTGKAPLTITEGHGSGASTVLDWPHEPVTPGKSGVIHVLFNAGSNQNNVDKQWTLYYYNGFPENSSIPIFIHLKSFVLPNPDVPVMTFTSTSYDFGKVNQGKTATTTFSFTNTGKSPLIIYNYKTITGSGILNYPKTPIPPGNSGTITVQINTEKTGKQFNKFIVNYDYCKDVELQIIGEIISPVFH
jgi:hypothetical protein